MDPLIGLKENVIIGKLIPAGTGMKRYRDVHLSTDIGLEDTLDLDDELDFDGDTDEMDTPDTAAASGLEGEIPEKTEPDDENVETEEEEAEPVTVGASDEE